MSQFSSEERGDLLRLARSAISGAILDRWLPESSTSAATVRPASGVFVTLHKNGRLRGCVGHIEDPGPVGELIVRSAVRAALYDYRFSPVVAEEIPSLEIEISVLSPLEPILPEAIIVGRHGLMIVNEEKRGLLLPQVAQERRWSSQRFLEETCEKAGLPREAWHQPATKIFAFTAEVFSETKPQPSSGEPAQRPAV